MMTVDEIYLNLAQAIAGAIEQDNWTKAKLDIEFVGDGVVGYTGEYHIDNSTVDISVRKIPREIRNWIKELQSITTGGGNNKWNRAIFTLTSDGKFNMEFIWDQDLHDQIKKLS
jgi:hypothetical protein